MDKNDNSNNCLQPGTESFSANQTLPQGRSAGPELKNLSKIRYKIFVMSGKGGVGKSSVAVNLAAALSVLGHKVGLLDVDLHGPSVPRMLGIAEGDVSGVKNNCLEPVKVRENLSVISVDTLLEDRDTAIIWRGPKKAGVIQQFLADTNWGELDFMVIDSPPGTGDEHLAILRTIPDALCMIVTTPQEIALADVRKAVDFLKTIGAKVLGVVENMSGFFCPTCESPIEMFRTHGGINLAKQYHFQFLGSIPLDPATAVYADRGIPAVFADKELRAKKAFIDLATKVIELCPLK